MGCAETSLAFFSLPHHLSDFWVACFEISRLIEKEEEDKDEKVGIKVRFCE